MRTLGSFVLLMCLTVQAALLADGPRAIAAMFGQVRDPAIWAVAVFVGAAVVEAFVFGLIFLLDREEYGTKINGHVVDTKEALQKIKSIKPSDQGDGHSRLMREGTDRQALLFLGRYGYARAYETWALVFLLAALGAGVVAV